VTEKLAEPKDYILLAISWRGTVAGQAPRNTEPSMMPIVQSSTSVLHARLLCISVPSGKAKSILPMILMTSSAIGAYCAIRSLNNDTSKLGPLLTLRVSGPGILASSASGAAHIGIVHEDDVQVLFGVSLNEVMDLRFTYPSCIADSPNWGKLRLGLDSTYKQGTTSLL
jgi:hypothetical protein